MKRWVRLAAIVGIVTIGIAPAVAGEMHLAWDPVPGALGYRVYYGTTSGNYTQSVFVGNTTQAVLGNLANCTEYFVAVRSYDAVGESVEFSNEISGWPRPAVSSSGVVQTMQGSSVWVTLAGANFDAGAAVTLLPDGIPLDENGDPLIRLETYNVQSCNQIQALLMVESSARGQRSMQIGGRQLGFDVVNPDQVFGNHGRSIDVEFNPVRADVNRSSSDTMDRVDGKDLIWLAYAHGRTQGDAQYNPDADLDGDGTVDGMDLALLASDFGGCWNGSDWTASACP